MGAGVGVVVGGGISAATGGDALQGAAWGAFSGGAGSFSLGFFLNRFKASSQALSASSHNAKNTGKVLDDGTASVSGAANVADPCGIRFTQATASPNLSSGSPTISALIKDLRAKPSLVSEIPALEVVEYNGKLYSLNNRRLVAFQQAGLREVPIQRLSLDDAAVRARFQRQVRDGLIDDGTKIIIVQGKKAQAEARRTASEFGRLKNP